MNMSYGGGGVTVSTPPTSGGGGGATAAGGAASSPNPPQSSSASSTPVPPVPPPFSMSSASFTFQNASANFQPSGAQPPIMSNSASSFSYQSTGGKTVPPPPPSFVPSQGFSFPGPAGNHPPSSGSSSGPPPLFPLAGGFSYSGTSVNTPAGTPNASAPAFPVPSIASGFSFQGPGGNTNSAGGFPGQALAGAGGSSVPVTPSQGSFPMPTGAGGFPSSSGGLRPTSLPTVPGGTQQSSQSSQVSTLGGQGTSQSTLSSSLPGTGSGQGSMSAGTVTAASHPATGSSSQSSGIQGSTAATATPPTPGLAAAPPAGSSSGNVTSASGAGISTASERQQENLATPAQPQSLLPAPVPAGFPPPATLAPVPSSRPTVRPSGPGGILPPSMPAPQGIMGTPGQGTQGTPSAPAPVAAVQVPGLTVLPGQGPGHAPQVAVGASTSRPGSVAPQPARPFTPARAVYSSGPVPAPQLVPPGVHLSCFVLGSAPAGMAPRVPVFTPMVRPPTFPPRPPLQAGSTLSLPRPVLRPGVIPPKFPLGPVGSDLGAKGVGPLLLPDKPQTTVYVGKIAPTVDDEFLRSILELCGPLKSWKRAPTTPKGFGFCEFESAEGVLRALRLLNKFSLEGQELVLNVNQATREYLERYVQKKAEREQQLKEQNRQTVDTEVETAPGVDVPETVKQPVVDATKKEASAEEQGSEESAKKFGIINDADKEADNDALKKLTNMLEEREKLKPLPPPPPLPSASDAGKSNSMSEAPGKSRDGESVAEGGRTADGHEGKNEEETSENKASSELDRPETSSSDRGRRSDSHRDRDRDKDRERDRDRDRDRRDRGRDRDRERDREREKVREQKREKEREFDRLERDRQRERERRQRDREYRSREAERAYEERERMWEEHEKDRERLRNREREKEKERERERRRLMKEQEEDSEEDGWRKRRHRGDTFDEKRRRIQRERDDDEEDRQREEQEIIEAKRRKLKEEIEEQARKKQAEEKQLKLAEAVQMDIEKTEDDCMETETTTILEELPNSESKEQNMLPNGDDVSRNGNSDMLVEEEDGKRAGTPVPKKLGFGLIGSGKRAAVPSVFHQEDEDEEPRDRSLRQLVPIDYSAEEMQVVTSAKPATPSVAPNLVAAAEFAKSLSNIGSTFSKDEAEFDRERSKRQNDRSKERERNYWEKEEDRFKEKDKDTAVKDDADKCRERERAKQLIDTIPKTKEELFAYKIDWAIYDQYDLHDRMRPWILKKITEYLGEEEATLVDFIVSNTRQHVTAAHMLELLEKILDEEAELFVLKMWRMLIFEIKKVEKSLAARQKG